MAKAKKRQERENPAPEAASALEGRQAIHGANEDYGDRVAQRAYELYLSRGRTDGQDFDDWLTAERELTNNRDGDPRQ
jgi:predicted component of type VI protein secretion system